MLTTGVSGEADLRPEVSTKVQSLTLAPGGDHLSHSQLTDITRLQAEFSDEKLCISNVAGGKIA